MIFLKQYRRISLLALWCILSLSPEAESDKFPQLPGATLLVGYPPSKLVVTTGDRTTKLQSESGDWYVTPSMSADGRVIASAHRVAGDAVTPRPRLVVSTYSMRDAKWTDYRQLEVFDGSVAISRDGLKLACVTRKVAGAPSRIRVLDLRSGTIVVAPDSSENAGPDLSWSPDGRRIAFQREVARSRNGALIPPLRAIYVWDIEAGTVSKIADGTSPSWSPSGEWIAFYDYSPGRDDLKGGWYAVNANRVSLLRPDGTSSKVLAKFRDDEDLHVQSVWSPDSKSILINRFRDEDKATMDIYMLELTTLKLTRKFKNVPPVFAWIVPE